MVIPDWMILQLCNGNVPDRIKQIIYTDPTMDGGMSLKVKPLVEPFDVGMINPASIDIRIGLTAKLRIVGGYEDIDLSEYSEQNPYWLKPEERILVSSLETFNLPPYISAIFYLKSSRGREWYEHMAAGYCDGGWNGSKLTMELSNFDIENLPLYPRLRIGQLCFQLMLAKPANDYSVTGRYNNDTTVQQSKG